MASPPFSLSTSVPGNSDVAAVFPALDRSDKDVIQSWLLVQMNSQGHDNYTIIDQVGSPNGPVSAPSANGGATGINYIYFDTDGSAKLSSQLIATNIGVNEFVGVPPGTIIDFAGGTAPTGYLLCNGQAVSRTQLSRLFAAIGTTWGAGDGSTTFNLPDLRGRATFGRDNMGGAAANLITVAGGNIDGTVLGNFGNLQNITIATANLPNINLSLTSLILTSTMTSASVDVNNNASFGVAVGGNLLTSAHNVGQQSITPTGFHITTTLSGTLPLGGSGTLLGILPNLAIVNKCIKF
jgi:microcystin-dependent protein